jgi:hypothetical protein
MIRHEKAYSHANHSKEQKVSAQKIEYLQKPLVRRHYCGAQIDAIAYHGPCELSLPRYERPVKVECTEKFPEVYARKRVHKLGKCS